MATNRHPNRDNEGDPVRHSGITQLQDLSFPSHEAELFAAMQIAGALHDDMRDEEVVHLFVESLRTLYPGRLFAARLVTPDTQELTLVYATGRLLAGERETIQPSSRCVLTPRAVIPAHGCVTRETSEYVPVFEDTTSGFDNALHAAGVFLGMFSVEYSHLDPPMTLDCARITPTVLSMASALRAGQMQRDAAHLRRYVMRLLEHSAAPMMVVGRDQTITMVNQALLNATRTLREDVVGQDFSKLVPPSEARKLKLAFLDALRGTSTSQLEVVLPQEEGQPVRLGVDVAPIAAIEGEIDSVIAIGHDLTRVFALQEQVIQAEKLATLGQLAAGVVHELNNPLTSIAVYADYLLKKAPDSSPDTERLRRIMEAADRMLHFTRDLVAYARPSREQPRGLDLSTVAEQSIVFCEHVISECGTHVTRAMTSPIPPVLGVRNQLQQVLINLITNACHAMPQDAGRLTVGTRADEEHVFVTVTDNGSGIRENNLERVFEPFFSTKGEGKGTGLGLSIVRNIVAQHHGNIRVLSVPGQGTTFEVTFPIAHEPEGDG